MADAFDDLAKLETALARITVLEMVIREELHPDECHCEMNRTIAEDIWGRYSSKRFPDSVSRATEPTNE